MILLPAVSIGNSMKLRIKRITNLILSNTPTRRKFPGNTPGMVGTRFLRKKLFTKKKSVLRFYVFFSQVFIVYNVRYERHKDKF